jgi:hypothetical protein
MVRFLVLAILVLRFGPGIVNTARIFFTEHYYWLLIAAVAALVIWLLVRRARKRPVPEAG